MGRRISPVERRATSEFVPAASWRVCSRAGFACAFFGALTLFALSSTPVLAAPRAAVLAAPDNAPARMVVNANELVQNDNTDTVTAKGNVQI